MEALGINLSSIAIYTLLFVAVYAVARKFFLDKLIDTLEQRRAEIQKGVALGAQMEKKIKEIEKRQEETLQEAKKEAKLAVEKAMEEAKQQRKKLLEETKKEADVIISKANEKLDQERAKLEASLNAKVEEAALRVVKKVYKQDKSNIDKKLIEEAIKEL